MQTKSTGQCGWHIARTRWMFAAVIIPPPWVSYRARGMIWTDCFGDNLRFCAWADHPGREEEAQTFTLNLHHPQGRWTHVIMWVGHLMTWGGASHFSFCSSAALELCMLQWAPAPSTLEFCWSQRHGWFASSGSHDSWRCRLIHV